MIVCKEGEQVQGLKVQRGRGGEAATTPIKTATPESSNFFKNIFQKPLAISRKICYYIQVTWMMTSIKQIGA